MRTPAKQLTSDSQAFAQLNLVHEDVWALVRGIVSALGGAKKVGPKLFPEKSEEGATRYLLDCLNPDRRGHEIKVEQFLLILRLARQAGFHFGMEWICDDLSYTRPSPVEPEDQRAELQRQFVAGVDRMEQLLNRIERLPK